MVKSRHRSGIRQFNKDKPTCWGIKLCILAECLNGYTIDFNVYIGKVVGQEVSANGLGYDVVMKLMTPYFNQGYHLYVDNFYTSVTLFKDLFARGVGATGTIRENQIAKYGPKGRIGVVYDGEGTLPAWHYSGWITRLFPC